MPDIESATMFKTRVGDMLHKGFEAALENSTPYCRRWPWTKPCCSWKVSVDGESVYLLRCWAYPTLALLFTVSARQ
eukprot:scaffold237729_cov45-Prasinocladus_malaysianus.AAC.1